MSTSDEKPHRESWPAAIAVNGWVIFNGSTQMGFALQYWAPHSDRWADASNYSDNVRGMGLPEALELWLLGLFWQGLLETVAIQRHKERWRIHLSLRTRREDRGTIIEIVKQLMLAASMAPMSDGRREEEVAALMGADKFFTHDDALAQWLSGQIQVAVQKIFRPRAK